MFNNNEINEQHSQQSKMTTNSRWTKEEELSLIKDIAKGINLEILSQKHNRTISAIEMRLKKIIYENTINGNTLEYISQLLKIDINKTMQYYYSYKEFLEKKTKNINNQPIQSTQPITQLELGNQLNNQINSHNTNEHFRLAKNVNMFGGGNNDMPNLDKAFNEPAKHDKRNKLESKLKKLEIENRILKLIVENKELTQQLNKLIKDGKVDPSIKSVIKSIRKLEE